MYKTIFSAMRHFPTLIGFWALMTGLCWNATDLSAQVCPVLDQNATFTSASCAPLISPCTLCPGDQFTLNATGTDLEVGVCVNWYYGTSNTFNPYNGEGILLGCALIENTPPIQIPAFTGVVTQDMCNNGPFWIVGIIEQLPQGCGQTFTNYLEFNVSCTTPVLGSANICHNGGNYDLTQLQDPAFPNGVWSGPGVSGTTFNPVGLFGSNILTFTPASACALPDTTTVTVFSAPTATFAPVAPVCPGQATDLVITFSGQAPWVFDLFAGATLVGAFTASNSPFSIPVNPAATTTYSIQNLEDVLCDGPDASVIVVVADIPTGVLTLTGPDTLCAGLRDTLQVQFANGTDPYTLIYSINGVAQPSINTNNNPHTFLTPPLVAGMQVFKLDSISANGCFGSTSSQDSIFVLPAPTAAILSDTFALCAGQTDTLRIRFTGPGPYTFQYSVRTNALPADTLPAIITSDSIHLIPITPPLGTTVYNLTSVSGGSCNGQISGTLMVTVGTPPTATLSGDTTICGGQSAPLTITLTGQPPFVINYSADGVPQPPDTTFFTTRVLTVTPTDTTNYLLTGVNSNGCNGNTSGSAAVNVLPALSAEISGGGQVCQGGNGTTITITFTGPGPYTFYYRAGAVVQPPITTTDNPHVISVNPPSGTFYQLDSVTNGICPGTVSGFALVAVFTPSTAELSGDITVCSAVDTTLIVDFTGSGPFLLEYSIDGVVQDTVETFDDPYLIPVNVTATTVFALVSVESPGCFGTVNGEATVFVNYPPELTNLFLSCDLVNQTYTIEFDAIGTPPFVVTGVGGSFTGDHFTSDPIPLNDPYTLLLNDAINCGQIPINGFSNCFCLTYAGDMDLDTLTGCTGDSVQALFLGFEELEVEDTLLFYLHTSPDTLGTVLDIQTQPVFQFQPGTMTLGTTYYISPVAGNNNGMGGINLNDPCLAVSPGTPVVWYEAPTATISGDFDICPGETVQIPVTLTGQPDFELTYTVNGLTETATALQNSYTISATLLDSTTFELVSVENATCPGTASGIVNVVVHTIPEITNEMVLCAPDNLTYTLEFDVENADLPSVILSGVVGGSYNPVTGHYSSDPIPVNTPFAISVSDVWQCGIDTISGAGACPCTTEAGLMDQTPLLLCAGAIATGTPATGTVLSSVDTLLYALVTTTTPSTWTILGIGDTPVFTFDPMTMTPGTTYYIFALAGIADPATGINLNHPCASVSVGSSVIWQVEPTVTLGTDATICSGDSTTLVFDFTGNAPYSVVYSANSVNQTAINTSDAQFLLTVSPAATTSYALSSASGNSCPAVLSGSATITVNSTPEILNATTTCDLATQTYVLTFEVTNVPNPVVSGISGAFAGTVFTSDSLMSGQPYNLTVTSPDGCTTTLTGSASCTCITDAGTMNATPLSVCLPDSAAVAPAANVVLAPGEVLQYILYQNPATLPAGILATNTIPEFDFLPGMLPGTTYFISAIAGLLLPDGSIDPASPCLAISPGVPVVFHNPPTATLNGDTTICAGSSTSFQIQFTGTPPFQFVYSVNGNQQTAISAPQNSFTVSSNNIQQDQEFILISVQDNFCTGTVSGMYNIDMQEGPTANIGSPTAICPGDSALLSLQLTGATLFDVTITGGPTPIQLNGVQNGANIMVAPASTTTYTISTLSAQGNTCPQTIGSGVVITVSPPLSAIATLSDFGGGFNVSCSGETDGSISLAAAGGTVPLTINWSTGESGATIQDLGAGTYTATVTDGIGCTYVDSFTLTAPDVLDVDFSVQDPACFGNRNATITLLDVQGGAGPFAVSLNSATAQIVDTFPFLYQNLAAGDYTITVADINGCEAELQIAVVDPPLLTVDLGMDVSVYLGDSILLDAIVNGTLADTFAWTPLNGLNAPDALNTYAKPLQTTTYKIWVQNTAGCQAVDEIRITVLKERRIYFPNIIKPGSSLANDAFTVYAGPEVALIRSFRIYDRWGECVFEKFDAKPNDPAQGWYGQFRGKDVLPGVYVFVVDLEYADGTTEVKSGDVTVIR